MQLNFSFGGVLVCVCLACTWSAPLQSQENEDADVPLLQNGKYLQIAEQERELENLAALAAQKQNGVEKHESHSMTYTNDNGKESAIENAETIVVNPSNDKLVSDIKQTLTRPENGKSRLETDIDIPTEEVHEKYVDSGDLDSDEELSEDSGIKDTIEFTPRSVALYLANTGAFDEFQEALEELVNTSMMTAKEAKQYENDVFDQYTQLVQNVEQDLQYPDDEPYYGYPYDMPEFPERQAFTPVEDDMLYTQYDVPEYAETYPELSGDEGRALLNTAIGRDQRLDMMIRQMIDEWLTRAAVNEEKAFVDPQTLEYDGDLGSNAIPEVHGNVRQQIETEMEPTPEEKAEILNSDEKQQSVVEQKEDLQTDEKVPNAIVPKI